MTKIVNKKISDTPLTKDHDGAGFNFTDLGLVSSDDLEILGGKKLGPLTKVMEEFFAGSALDAKWTVNNLQGTNTEGLVSGINGGWEVTTGSATSDGVMIGFNNLKHFDPRNCTMYMIFAIDNIAFVFAGCGISELDTVSWNNTTNEHVGVAMAQLTGLIAIDTRVTTTRSTSSSDICLTSNPTAVKLICGPDDLKLYSIINGIWSLILTQTVVRPTQIMQPTCEVFVQSALSRIARFIYFKVQNDS